MHSTHTKHREHDSNQWGGVLTVAYINEGPDGAEVLPRQRLNTRPHTLALPLALPLPLALALQPVKSKTFINFHTIRNIVRDVYERTHLGTETLINRTR